CTGRRLLGGGRCCSDRASRSFGWGGRGPAGNLGRRPGVPAGRSSVSAASAAVAADRRRRVQVRVGRVVGRTEVVLDDPLHRAVLPEALEDLVDLLAALGVLVQADAVVLLAERRTHDPQLTGVLVLGGIPRQDGVVGGERVDGAVGQLLDALGVGAVLLQLDAGHLLLDVRGRGRPGDRAEQLAVQVVQTLDVAVRRDEEVLTGDEVGAGELDLLLACVGDRVGREDHVDLVGGQQVLALGRGSLAPGDVVLGDPERLGDRDRDVDVHAGVVVTLLQAETRLVELDADGQALARTSGGGVLGGAVVVGGGVLGCGAAVTAVTGVVGVAVAAAGAEHQGGGRQGGGDAEGGVLLHGGSPSVGEDLAEEVLGTG